MKSITLSIAMLLALMTPALAQADMSGLWRSEFFGNQVECQLEQRGQYIYGVATVTTNAGERNVYHIAGVVFPDGRVLANHGSGNFFEGSMTGKDTASGTFNIVKKGVPGPKPVIEHSFDMRAQRVTRGIASAGGLAWPENWPPAK